jgi:diketogulonate reductase-like aldo/keto reductase
MTAKSNPSNQPAKDQSLTTNQGNTIPVLGLGVWKSSKDECYQAVMDALELGYRHIDTAAIYANEESVGKAIADSKIERSEVFITTKLWNADQGASKAEKAFEKSLQKLNLDYVDLYLIHFPVSGIRNESWKILASIYKSGRAKSIGVSNFMIPHLEELIQMTGLVPAINQIEVHPFLNQKELRDYCASKKILVEAYSPLAHGKRIQDPAITKISQKYNRTNAQILIRWSIQSGMIVLPKSVKRSRIEENGSVFDFQLDNADMEYLNSLDENYRTCWDPSEVV